MNTETHLIEWKASWRDDNLRALCGLANDEDEPVGAPGNCTPICRTGSV
jgi:hypothetical protein